MNKNSKGGLLTRPLNLRISPLLGEQLAALPPGLGRHLLDVGSGRLQCVQGGVLNLNVQQRKYADTFILGKS